MSQPRPARCVLALAALAGLAALAPAPAAAQDEDRAPFDGFSVGVMPELALGMRSDDFDSTIGEAAAAGLQLDASRDGLALTAEFGLWTFGVTCTLESPCGQTGVTAAVGLRYAPGFLQLGTARPYLGAAAGVVRFDDGAVGEMSVVRGGLLIGLESGGIVRLEVRSQPMHDEVDNPITDQTVVDIKEFTVFSVGYRFALF